MDCLVCFITWNRLGITIRSLQGLLQSKAQFDLIIIDNNSCDGTWDYLQTIEDDRIILMERMQNRGVVYAINYALTYRKKNQFFWLVENDVHFQDIDWFEKVERIFDTFPDLGLVAVPRIGLFEEKNITKKVIENEDGTVGYHPVGHVLGCCTCLRPEILDILGYWNEETHAADIDLNYRIVRYTPYNMGYAKDIMMDQLQSMRCDKCSYKEECSLIPKSRTCLQCYKEHCIVHDREYIDELRQGHRVFMKELEQGDRTVYCASIHDEDSQVNRTYKKELAEGFFNHFLVDGN